MYPSLDTNTSFSLRNVLIVGLSTILALAFLAYIAYQARFLLLGPQITFIETGQSPTEAPVTELVGKAQNITYLTLNGRAIFTDQHGVFNETLVLNEGYNLITLVAYDRYGRERTVTQEYVRTPQTNSEPTNQTTPNQSPTATN